MREKTISVVVAPRLYEDASIRFVTEERMRSYLRELGCEVMRVPVWTPIDHWALDGSVQPMWMCLLRGEV